MRGERKDWDQICPQKRPPGHTRPGRTSECLVRRRLCRRVAPGLWSPRFHCTAFWEAALSPHPSGPHPTTRRVAKGQLIMGIVLTWQVEITPSTLILGKNPLALWAAMMPWAYAFEPMNDCQRSGKNSIFGKPKKAITAAGEWLWPRQDTSNIVPSPPAGSDPSKPYAWSSASDAVQVLGEHRPRPVGRRVRVSITRSYHSPLRIRSKCSSRSPLRIRNKFSSCFFSAVSPFFPLINRSASSGGAGAVASGAGNVIFVTGVIMR